MKFRLITTYNEYGMTFEEWRKAAAYSLFDLKDPRLNQEAIKQAWLDGDDVSEHRRFNESRKANS